MKREGFPAEPQPVREVEVLQVIKTTGLTGNGDDDDPVRTVDQFFAMDGKHLFKIDRWDEEKKEPEPVYIRWPGLDEEGRVRAVADLLDSLSRDPAIDLRHPRFRGDFVRRLARLFREMTEKLYAKPETGPEQDPSVVLKEDPIHVHGPKSVFAARCDLARRDESLATTMHEFCGEMFLDVLRAEKDGKEGWDDPQQRDFLMHELHVHAEQGKWVGVANFAAFLWNLDREWQAERERKEKEEGCQGEPSS